MSNLIRSRDRTALQAPRSHVEIVLSQGESITAEMPDAAAHTEFDLIVNMAEAGARIDEAVLKRARILVIEVVPEIEASLERLAAVRAHYPRLPIVGAVRGASLPVARALLRSGVNDIIELPLVASDLTAAIDRIRSDLLDLAEDRAGTGKLVSVIKSVGGVGATAILTQLACLQAQRPDPRGGEACLIDLDLQFGNAATYLGMTPALSVTDLLEAGSRVDAALLRSAGEKHESGLQVIAAPREMIPLESASADQILDLVELATHEFSTVFVDLPTNWTNWSLSVVARSQIVLLVIELSIASIRQAQRQLSLLDKQGLSELPVQIVVNRVERKLFKTIDLKDAERALGRKISLSIANDFPLVSAALDRGVPLSTVKAKSRVHRDIENIASHVNALLGRAT